MGECLFYIQDVLGSNPSGVTKSDKDYMKEEYEVLDTWSKKIVYSGTQEQCMNYLRGNNVYQMNYSKLKLKKIKDGSNEN